MSSEKLTAIDFFCSGGGMSYGMQKAGIDVIAGIDFDSSCRETYEANIKGAKFIHADVFYLDERSLEVEMKLQKNDDNLVLIGCSPCQYWTIMKTSKNKSEKSKGLLVEFSRFVKYFKPGYVVVENVPGILRRKEESGLEEFVEWLTSNGYVVSYGIHEVSEYNVPQHRKRFTLIANRLNTNILQPVKSKKSKLKVSDVIGVKNGFPKIPQGHKDPTDFMHSTAGLNLLNLERLSLTAHNGGTRLAYVEDKRLAPRCHYKNVKSFKDVYGRMWWDRPAPTITTKFFSISNGRFAHPEEDRALSIREGAVLQSFPKSYKFIGTSVAGIARMIGNAVPPKYAESIGKALIKNYNNG